MLGGPPLYRQLADELLRRIECGELAVGEALPGEHKLCASYGVSRITVRKALDGLVAAGVVERRQGLGSFVARQQQDWSVTLDGILEDVVTPQSAGLVRVGEVKPGADLLRLAGLIEGGKLLLYTGLNRTPAGKPLVHLNFYFPPAVARHITDALLQQAQRTMGAVEAATGFPIDHAEQIVVPQIADAAVAASLDVPAGTAVLRCVRKYFDTTGGWVELLDAHYHPENYRYKARLQARRTTR